MDGGFFGWLRRAPVGERLREAHLREDLVEAAEQAAFGRPCEREVAAVDTVLKDDEVVQQLLEGRRGKVAGLLVLTTRRILFAAEGADPRQALVVDRADVTSASGQVHRGLGTLTLRTRTLELVVDQVLGTQAESFARNATGTPTHTPADLDPLAELSRLRARHQAGEISDAEFETRKRQLFEQI